MDRNPPISASKGTHQTSVQSSLMLIVIISDVSGGSMAPEISYVGNVIIRWMTVFFVEWKGMSGS